MRELKFRCWRTNGVMDYYDSLQEIADYYRSHKYQAEMQYTGLEDKNGKEIYEDDILIDASGIKELVCYDIYHGWGCPSSSWIPLSYIHTSHHVIGNRYENPELLDSTQ